MQIKKRNGTSETLSFDKVLKRMNNLANDERLGAISGIDADIVAQKVINRIYDQVSSEELDELAAQLSISMSIDHPGYGELASRIVISNCHKKTGSFSHTVEVLGSAGVLNSRFVENARTFKAELDGAIDYQRDYLIDYFGYKTLERSYLLRDRADKIMERPQHMWMRVALALHGQDIEKVLESYKLLSQKYFTHASPTLFNAGGMREQNSSCYLMGTSDSLEGIFKTMTDCAKISKYAGGIGLHISNIRAKGSKIRGTNGKSDGIVPMLKAFNEVSRYINQGGKRNGSFAIYIEPYHADILEFLDLRKNTGEPNLRARDLFYALWVCDLFMERVEQDLDWQLFCPDECPGLQDAFGTEFKQLYEHYTKENKMKKTIKARFLWEKILSTQIETGMPYMAYKDAANEKSNQKHFGTIKSSNLCCEIFLCSSDTETSVCNIATLGLPMYVKGNAFDLGLLEKVTRVLVRNLNRVIDVNYYPTPESARANKDHRPIAIGVQGLYDVFMKLKLPFDSPDASELNKKIFEHIQFAAISESCELARQDSPYPMYPGSPISKGVFQHNMWGITEKLELELDCDWEALRERILQFGVRNALLTALPPTASTSQILGNTESFEVITSNLYMRRVLGGNYPVVNKHLIKDLLRLGLWNKSIKEQVMISDGSIQNIASIPENLKKLYKTTWETSQKVTIKLSAERAPFIDHSQSLNLFMAIPTIAKLSSAHFYGWKCGLKTGQYYLRSKPASTAEKFSIQGADTSEASANEASANEASANEASALACSIDNKEDCEMCSG
jgi:ribonucleoside-diphosphate reductase alpha subunit